MTDPHFHSIEVANAVERTRELRRSDKGRWKAVRRRLSMEGVGPGDAAVGGLFPEGRGTESGLVVTRDGRFFLMTLEWNVDEEGRDLNSYDDAWLWDWNEVGPAQDGALAYLQALGRSLLDND